MEALHHAFYARYLSAGDKAHASGSKARIAAGDRLVLLIGELQTNVNRCGFAQYLAHKGRRRAESALRALTTVGATQTANLLAAALAPGVSAARLSVLDRRFSISREDLPALTMRYMQRHEPARDVRSRIPDPGRRSSGPISRSSTLLRQPSSD
jgi:hypothetical protein